MSTSTEETLALRRHLAYEAKFGIHPDGCYYCGRLHFSRDCNDPEREIDPQEDR
jgi:hypothetical protein